MAEIPKAMEAVVLTGPGTWAIREVPTPRSDGTDVLCCVRSVAICGTDPGIIDGAYSGTWPPQYPFIIGHEWAGEVVSVGREARGSQRLARSLAPGTRVAGEAHCGCGICPNCLKGDYTICLNYGDNAVGHRHYGFTTQGAYAQYIRVSLKSIHRLPPNLSYDEAAMIDMAGVALHAVRRGGVCPGDTCCVVGEGPVGIMTLQMCQAAGAASVIVVGFGPRLQMAVRLGAVPVDLEKTDEVLAEVLKLTGNRGADVVFECAGVKHSCAKSPLMARKGGKVVLVALAKEPVPIEWTRLTLSQVDLIGVRANPNTTEAALALLAAGKVDAKLLHTHSFPLERFGDALAAFRDKKGGAMKVVVHP